MTTDISIRRPNYEPILVAGIWNKMPRQLPTEPFPYLGMSQSTTKIPTKDIPLYRFDAATARRPDEAFMIPGVPPDPYSILAEQGLVKVCGWRNQRVDALLHNKVRPVGLHPAMTEALGTFMHTAGSSWDADSIALRKANKNFATLSTPVPRETLTLDLGGPVFDVQSSALVAAGLRMAMIETVRLHEFKELYGDRLIPG